MARLDNPVAQYLDASGDPVPGGKLFFFESGTFTPRDTFVDVNLSTKNANPVILDGAGRIPNIFLSGTYKVILKDANDVQIWERDPVGGEAGAQFSDWDSLAIYNLDDVVQGSDGEFYQSILPNNQASDPTTTATAWTPLVLLKSWNTNESYALNDTVRGSNGNIYKSLVGSNSGNDPVSSPDEWSEPTPEIIKPWDVLVTYDINDNVKGSDGNLYRALTGSNLGNDPISSPSNWRNAVDGFVPDIVGGDALKYIQVNATEDGYNKVAGGAGGGLDATTWVGRNQLTLLSGSTSVGAGAVVSVTVESGVGTSHFFHIPSVFSGGVKQTVLGHQDTGDTSVNYAWIERGSPVGTKAVLKIKSNEAGSFSFGYAVVRIT